MCLVTGSCPTLCNHMDCTLLGSSVHGDFPGKNTGVGSYALLQGIYSTQVIESRSPSIAGGFLTIWATTLKVTPWLISSVWHHAQLQHLWNHCVKDLSVHGPIRILRCLLMHPGMHIHLPLVIQQNCNLFGTQPLVKCGFREDDWLTTTLRTT